MQRFAGVTVSDPASLGAFCRAHAELTDLAREMSGGGWGLGFWGAGEMLVRKTPISSRFESLRVLDRLNARQVVLVADDAAALRSMSSSMQPLRHRDWVFCMTGGPDSVDDFIGRASDALAGFTSARHTVPEATMMLIMESLYRHNVLDRRPLTTDSIHTALGEGIERVTEHAGGREGLAMSVLLHIQGHVFGLSAGRPLRVARYQHGRSARSDGMRVVLVTDQDVPDTHEQLDWSGVELCQDCSVREFSLY